MTRKLLEWSDIRPTLLRAQGRSGVEYEIQQTTGGRWVLWRGDPDDGIERVSDGWLADMKGLAEQHEADAVGPAPEPQRIEWTKERPGYHRGIAPCGLVYLILKVGDVWQLECQSDGDFGNFRGEGSLAEMKAAASRNATEVSMTRRAEEGA